MSVLQALVARLCGLLVRLCVLDLDDDLLPWPRHVAGRTMQGRSTFFCDFCGRAASQMACQPLVLELSTELKLPSMDPTVCLNAGR